MERFLIDFTWHRDLRGYRVVEAELDQPGLTLLGTKKGRPERIVRLGGELQPYRPLTEFPTLYKIYATSVRSPASALNFMEKFGPLTAAGLREAEGEAVEALVVRAQFLQSYLAAATGDELARDWFRAAKNVVDLRARLEPDPVSGAFRLALAPHSLLDGLFLQAALALAGSTNWQQCEYCGQPFESGIGTGRRADARFCSKEHQKLANSKKRSKRSHENA